MNGCVVVSTEAKIVVFGPSIANEVWPSLEVVRAHKSSGPQRTGATPERFSVPFSVSLVECMPRLRRLAIRLAGDKTAGDDLLQNTLLRALERSNQYHEEPGADVFNWASRILRRLHCDLYRKRRDEVLVAQFDDCADELPVDQMALWRKIDDEAVKTAVAALPRTLRQAYALFVEGHCYSDIANLLDITIGTVGARIHRARERLRKALLQVTEAHTARAYRLASCCADSAAA